VSNFSREITKDNCAITDGNFASTGGGKGSLKCEQFNNFELNIHTI
jgi:hypothetical protein